MKCPKCGSKLLRIGGSAYQCKNEECDIHYVSIRTLKQHEQMKANIKQMEDNILKKSKEKREK